MQSVGNILKSSTLWLHSKNFFSLLSAKKYLRALSETALLYRPAKLRELTPEENLKDRVVQTFFDTSKISIKVS